MDWRLTACLLILLIMNQKMAYAVRVLNGSHIHVPPPMRSFNNQQKLTFFMEDVLATSKSSPPSSENEKPMVIPQSTQDTQSPPPSLAEGLPFISSNLKYLEVGVITGIDEELTDGYMSGAPMVGKVRGITVTRSIEGGTTNQEQMMMIAMVASFDENGNMGDSLKFFGLHHSAALESHIAVIGGTGRYFEANGFATVRNVAASANEIIGRQNLLVTVYLK